MPPHGIAHRPAVAGSRGVVTSAHYLASMAGAEMLCQGGNAMDAAVATAAALNVVEPYMSGLAGCGVMLISSARRRERVVLDYTGVTPQAADPARCTLAELKVGPKSVVTPGNLGGWLTALARFGSMERQRVLAPAIRLAEEGFPLSRKNCEFAGKGEAQLAGSEEARRIVLGGGALAPGRRFVQADLGRTLRQIAEGGAEVLYGGPLGRTIARAVQAHGGWLDEADLAACRPAWQTPIAGGFRGVELLVAASAVPRRGRSSRRCTSSRGSTSRRSVTTRPSTSTSSSRRSSSPRPTGWPTRTPASRRTYRWPGSSLPPTRSASGSAWTGSTPG